MSLFASMLCLDRMAHRRLKITDPYSLHRVVYSLFEDVRDEAGKRTSVSSGILYADRGGDRRERRVLLLSDREPRLPLSDDGMKIETRPLPSAFLAFDAYRFQIIVNPTRRAGGKTVPVKGRDAIAVWFCERAPINWGFEVARDTIQTERIEVSQFTGKDGDPSAPITLMRAHLTGSLRVTDRTLFQSAFRRGIGRGHAFGCGLLQLSPPSLID
jgi:CRISPR system Cascade subunit CasE